MRDAYPDKQVQAELKRLYEERHGKEPDAMALSAFTIVAQTAYQSAIDVRQWTTIMDDPTSRAADADLPCGAEMMGQLRDLAGEAMENVKKTN